MIKELIIYTLAFLNDRKKTITFLYCLIIATVTWLFILLNKETKLNLRFCVQYDNVPQNMFVNTKLPDTIIVQVKGRIIDLYLANYRNKILHINLNDVDNEASNEIVLNNLTSIQSIASQFSSGIQILTVSPKVIKVAYREKFSKKVPVKLNALLNYVAGYYLISPISIMPKNITIYGDSTTLAGINYIETENMILKSIKSSISKTLLLKNPFEQKNITFSIYAINAKLNVAEFSEAKFVIPISLKNAPLSKSLRIYPNVTTITVLLPLKDYKNIKATDFEAFVDYNDYLKTPLLAKLKVNITTKISLAKNIQLSIQNVEFIFKK